MQKAIQWHTPSRFARYAALALATTFFAFAPTSNAHATQSAKQTIRVGRSCSCKSCSTVITVSIENYTKHVLPNEWIPSWHAQSLRAGAIAIRSYAEYFCWHPVSASFDICDTTCCQVYGNTASSTDAAVDATAGIYLVDGAGNIVFAEYSAENNDSNGADGCGNCYTSNKSGDGICLSDSVCCGTTKNGHGRGMCQWGSQRWALQGRSFEWIIDHYYGAYGYRRTREPMVDGAIKTKYYQIGGLGSPIGEPITYETKTPDNIGRFNQFSINGSIYWTQANGAWSIHGLIKDKWAALGWETGVCGYPITDETGTPDGVGRYNHFSKGASIYFTPATGAREVGGAIRVKWQQLGWESGVCGYPTTDESICPDNVGRFNHFNKNASIYWTAGTGAHQVGGLIRDKWASLGWERSSLGYPTSDEYAVGSDRRSDFQNGTITWHASTGQTTVP